jgi:flagellar motor switch protein FliM
MTTKKSVRLSQDEITYLLNKTNATHGKSKLEERLVNKLLIAQSTSAYVIDGEEFDRLTRGQIT